jgi:hypothetical protein
LRRYRAGVYSFALGAAGIVALVKVDGYIAGFVSGNAEVNVPANGVCVVSIGCIGKGDEKIVFVTGSILKE